MLNNINIQGEYKKKRKTKALASLRKQAAVQPQKKRHGYVVICSLVSFWLGFNVTLYWLIHYHIISLSSPHGLKGKAWNERGEIEILAGSEPSQPIIRMKFRWCVCVCDLVICISFQPALIQRKRAQAKPEHTYSRLMKLNCRLRSVVLCKMIALSHSSCRT